MRSLSIAAGVLLLASAALAQTPYGGMQTRPIKALSDDQVADLKNGRGMGLALAAELNGYPGPSHVLELADKLALSADQRAKVQQLFDSMKAEALPVGGKLIEQETELDRLFASRTVAPDSLKRAHSSYSPNPRRVAGNTSQIPPVYAGFAQRRSNSSLQRVTGLQRRASTPDASPQLKC